jgi:hypothetical protein
MNLSEKDKATYTNQVKNVGDVRKPGSISSSCSISAAEAEARAGNAKVIPSANCGYLLMLSFPASAFSETSPAFTLVFIFTAVPPGCEP